MPATEEVWKHGLCFIGVIKIETRKFPIAYLSTIYLQNQGNMSVLLTRSVDRTKPVLGEFVWIDQNRRYFIFTGGYMDKGHPYTWMQQIQEEPTTDADPNMVDLDIPQPITAEIYYSTCDQIERAQ